MIALDFKLTSGQVRRLLAIYHGRTLGECESPATDMLREHWDTPHFFVVSHALVRKGLIEHRPAEYPHGQCWHVTPRGRAIAELIVEQARKIVALDESRIAREARLAAEVAP